MKKTAIRHFRMTLPLLLVNIAVAFRQCFEFIRVIYRYYPHTRFLAIDLSLHRQYLLDSPYSISKRFEMDRGNENPYVYGETPLTTLDTITKAAKLSADDVVFDLGCGPGRTSFWLHTFIGCRVVGIEHIAAFIDRAQQVKERHHMDEVEFRIGDIRDVDYASATAIYLYGTCFDDDFLQPLIERFRQCTPGTKIITVSYPLRSHSREGGNPNFEVLSEIPARFAWGKTTVFVQQVTG